ncbi:ABC transporter ATP-binding protein [Aquibaculum arenosum]|uniref:ATP-binding cassette domain-containing protein n=1 Tax=Aquibaculum arenosum TaxID=3032591 RepID=A0ABT5YL86_9PROT|nr:ATP-binding cassette domain-containing protein [Fodinicurvata sp. CAU 1616]MDF2095689.1 ATP-binding cassette domain-containing protein [Fodinicurvata sp. CAU 1616]
MTDQPHPFHVTGLAKSFGEKQVLRDVEFTVRRGASTVLIGPSSSGKTVLLKCMLGLLPIDAGSIEIEGRTQASLNTAQRREQADRMGVAFQQNALFDSMSCWENVAFRLLQRGDQDRAAARAQAIEQIGRFGLRPEVADRYPAEISGGMQKRIGLARAFVSRPAMLMLDAPTDGLDPIMTRHTNRLIRAAVEESGATVFAITTDMRAALEFYDRLMMLHDGRIIWEGTTDEARHAEEPRLRQLLEGRSEGPIRMAVRA